MLFRSARSQLGQLEDVDGFDERVVAGEERLRGDGGHGLRRVVGVPEQVAVAVAAQRDRLVTPRRPERTLAAARRLKLREAYKSRPAKSQLEEIHGVFAQARSRAKAICLLQSGVCGLAKTKETMAKASPRE